MGEKPCKRSCIRSQAQGHDKIYLSYEPENVVGAQFYASLGFRETGRIDDGEIVVCLETIDE